MVQIHTSDFKFRVCKAKEWNPDKTFKQIGTEYGINGGTVSDWYRKYRLYGENAFDPEAQRLANEKELLHLMKENDDLKEENEILKKQWLSLQRAAGKCVRIHQRPY